MSRIFTNIGQAMRHYWPKRTRLEDERDEILLKPADERTLSDWVRLIEISKQLDQFQTAQKP